MKKSILIICLFLSPAWVAILAALALGVAPFVLVYFIYNRFMQTIEFFKPQRHEKRTNRNIFLSLFLLVIIRKSKMKLSDKGIEHIIKNEGIRRKPYKDSQGYWTIGIGHLITDAEENLLNKTLTDNEVKELFKKDVDRFEKCVSSSVKRKLKQHEFDALVSFAFNVGCGGFKKSLLLSYLNQAHKIDRNEVERLFMNWTKNPELKTRRLSEVELFNYNQYYFTHSNLKSKYEDYFV